MEKAKKVLIVVGATGSGKSNLSVKLACSLGNAEIISVDSMQIYKGLDIASNKITKEEMEAIPHHMLDIVELTDNSFDVRAFCNMSRKIIDDIHNRGKLPILVGGTHYYVFSLLWNTIIIGNSETEKEKEKETEKETEPKNTEYKPTTEGLNGISQSELDKVVEKIKTSVSSNAEDKDTRINYTKREVEVMFSLLSKVDPIMTEKLHAQDVRKIEKSLKIFFRTGQRQSDIIIKQKQNLQPVYDAHILCLTADKNVLDTRIDARVDKMIQRGLLTEVKSAWGHLSESGVDVKDHTLGILQAIGFKEFSPAFQKGYFQSGSILQPEQEQIIVDECVEKMKTHTRQYSRQQTKWIKKLVDGDGSNTKIPISYLDATDLSTWQQSVFEPALSSAKSFLSSSSSSSSSFSSSLSSTTPPQTNMLLSWKKYICDICDGKSLNGTNEWNLHRKSSAHKKRQKKMKKQQSKPEPMPASVEK